MVKFIKLTEQGNNKVHYINVNHICYIFTEEKDTIVRIKDEYLYFTQSVDEVMDLINEK